MGAPRDTVAAVTGLSVDIRRKRFGDIGVLDRVAFSLAPGERACILGPSGCGKSTLLSLIAGTEVAFEGTVTCPRGPVAMIFQAPRLLPWRTLVQNIVLTPGPADEPAARALLARVGLGAAADQYPEKVSLGMQRRAALARALSIEPALVLMDEPLVSLDRETSADMQGLITDMLDHSEATTLIATHDRREALALADRIIELDGSPATLIRDRQSPLSRDERRQEHLVEDLHQAWFPVAETGRTYHSDANTMNRRIS